MHSGFPDLDGPDDARRIRRRHLVTGAAIGLVILGGGAATLLTLSQGPVTRTVADGCGLITCGTHLNHSATGLSVRSTPRASSSGRPEHRPGPPTPTPGQPTPTAAPEAQSSSPHPSPSSPTPTPSPTATPSGPVVTVTLAVDTRSKGHPGFHGHLTIVNNGTAAISDWTLSVSLSGDTVTWAGYPGTGLPFAFWQFSGGTLTLNAVSSGESLTPGSTEVVPIVANGSTTTPGACTFNGSACQP